MVASKLDTVTSQGWGNQHFIDQAGNAFVVLANQYRLKITW